MDTRFVAPDNQRDQGESSVTTAADPAPLGPATAGGRAGSHAARETLLALLALALLTLYSPTLEAPYNTLRLIALAVAGLLGTAPLLHQARSGDKAAVAAVATLAWAAASTALSSRPWLTFVGPPTWSTGWLFLWGLAGIWAATRQAAESARQLVGRALVLGLAVNGAMAWLQAFVDLPLHSLDPGGRALGLAGNSAHLGTLCAVALVGGLAWFADRPRTAGAVAARSRWTALGAGALVGGALQASGSRGALGVALLGIALVLVRRRRRALVLAVVGAAIVGGLVVSSFAPITAATGRVASDGVRDAGGRASIWTSGVTAANARPVFGWGPMRFAEGTARTSGTVILTSQLFTDAHNVVLELAVGIGYVGAALALAWLGFAVRRVRGPWAFALAAFVPSLFMQPMSITVYPAVMFALALATPRYDTERLAGCGTPTPADRGTDRHRTLRRMSMITGSAAVAVGGTALLVGTWMWHSGKISDDADRLAGAARLLPNWPELALDRVDTEIWLALSTNEPDQRTTHRERAIRFARNAVRAEPTDVNALTTLASLEVKWGDPAAAKVAASALLKQLPESVAARAVLADAAHRLGDDAEKDRMCAEIKERNPNYKVESCVNAR